VNTIEIQCETCGRCQQWTYDEEPYGGEWYDKEKRPRCCDKIMYGRNLASGPMVKIKGDYMKRNSNNLDGGIPFGEVPGDADYNEIADDGDMKTTDFLKKKDGKYNGPMP
jgi:hypothetical protein